MVLSILVSNVIKQKVQNEKLFYHCFFKNIGKITAQKFVIVGGRAKPKTL